MQMMIILLFLLQYKGVQITSETVMIPARRDHEKKARNTVKVYLHLKESIK